MAQHYHNLLLALALCGAAGAAQASEKADLLLLKNTTINLIEALVKQGVLTQKAADLMVQSAKAKAEAEAGQQQTASEQADAPVEPGDVRVSYVPQFVKDEIRQQVRKELKAEVVGDVVQKAKTEKWGLPEALPDWVNRFTLSGDLRLRSQNDLMSNDNISGNANLAKEGFLNYRAINQNGRRFNNFNDYLNTTKDRHRFRERLRLALDAKITDGLSAGIRLATGNQPDAVSTNQSLGITGGRYEFNIDRAFLKYDAVDKEGFKWLTLAGGRIANPWYVGGGEFTGGSELVWDTDLSFEGFAATGRYSLGSVKAQGKHDASREIHATAGAFPLEESQLSSSGKWLVGGQVGLDWGFANKDALRLGLAYYDYINIQAKPNNSADRSCGNNSAANNFSVPQFQQFGNTLSGVCFDQQVGGNPQLFGLASDYNIVNFNIAYDLALFSPYRLLASADYAKNVGFHKTSVNALNPVNNQDGLTQTAANPNGNGSSSVSDETNAWQVRLDFGWPLVEKAGQWNVFAFYKYIERDAVLDAFTDSDFHLGGTNAKGWVIGGNYGLMKNLWLTGRWLSSDTVSGPRYGIDTLQIDVNARF